MLDLELDDVQIDRYRKIASNYLKSNKAHVVVQKHKWKYQIVFVTADGHKQFDEAEFGSLVDAEEYLQDDYLPNLGARIQQQKMRMFQWLM